MNPNNNKSGFFQVARRGRNDAWIYLLTILAVASAYVIGQIPMFALLMAKVKNDDRYDESHVDQFMENPDFSIFDIDRNFGFFLLLLMFIFACIVLLLCVKYMHKKNPMHLITTKSSVDYKKIFFGFGFWFALAVAFEMISYFVNPENYTFRFNGTNFIILLLISVTLLTIQTNFEELLFRGYILQGIGLLAKNKWVPLILTSLLFGLIHSSNPEIEKYGFWTMQAYYLSAGLILGIMTVMDDGLELAMGVHFATNFFAAVFVGFEGAALQTDTLFVAQEANAHYMLLAMVISGVIFLWVCSKKYNWNSFKNIFEPIHIEEFENEEIESEIP